MTVNVNSTSYSSAPLFQCWLVSKLERWNRVSNALCFFSWLDAERLGKRYHAERGNEVDEVTE
jgi:hypothetical protein